MEFENTKSYHIMGPKDKQLSEYNNKTYEGSNIFIAVKRYYGEKS